MSGANADKPAKLDGRQSVGDQLTGLRILIDEVGLIDGLAVTFAVARPGALARVFASLPAASDARERASRQQAGPAIVMYRVLAQRRGRDEALRVSARVIEQGALGFLGRQLADLQADAFAGLAEEARRSRAQGWLERFFTSDSELVEVGPERVVFEVRRCALARLSNATGHPELAPLFCRADAAFFARRQPPVEMKRPTTLADGGTCCRFELSLTTNS